MSLANKRKIDYEKGKSVEDEFSEKLESIGFDLINSTPEQDMSEGWDIYITTASNSTEYTDLIGKKIDVKGIKGDIYNWVEFIAKDFNGYKLGWSLRNSLVDYIAFKIEDEFILVDKIKLKEFLFKKIPLLKKLDGEIKNRNNYNEIMKLKISSFWGEFDITNDKDKSLYEKVYVREVTNRHPDMITKIKNSDLYNIGKYIIK